MPRIHQLSDEVANQIAAGEVVERPAAVVKELVENALDASATQIEIEFRHGGKSYLRVTDNGHGMDREDAQRALQRHATSKLREARDLLSLGSFGFRGEALPSIASVSRFTLRTREAVSEGGTEILLDGSVAPIVRDCGHAPGTTIEVARLFHTVPARRKFLKTDRTEAAHIVLLCRLLAVAHPEVAFTLLEDGQIRFRAASCDSLTDRIREVFGRSLSTDLMPIRALEPDPAHAGISVSGLIGKPGIGRATRAELFTFVNRRPVDSRVLNYALIESFHTYIPKGRYPIAFLFLDLPAAAVDVNVHPTKREVRFRNDAQVRGVVMDTLLASLRQAARDVLAHARPVESARPLSTPPPARSERRSEHPPPARPASPVPLSRPEPSPEPSRELPPPAPVERVPASAKAPPAASSSRTLEWRFLAFAHDRLALFESRDGIVALHVTAASERIAYETFLEQWEGHTIPIQNLLFPVSVELDPVRSEVLAEHLAFFAELGLEVEPFGRNFFRLRTAPQALTPEVAKTFLIDLVALIAERGLRPSQKNATREAVAQLAASRLARHEFAQDADSAERLVRQLLSCRQPLADPRGRPTFFELSRREWEKRLGL